LEPNWHVLVRTWGPMVYSTAWRVLGHAADAEDVVQDVSLKPCGCGKVRESQLGGWLRRWRLPGH